MNDFEAIKQYLDEIIIDPIPRYIYLREIEKRQESEVVCTRSFEQVRESRWYRQLEDGMLGDGSYGRFHSMDSKDKTRRVFKTTEEAIRRMKDMGLPSYDMLIKKVCNIMSKYISGEEIWSDRCENFYGFEVTLNSMVGANMALLSNSSDDTHRYKKLCAFYLEEAYHDSDIFRMDVWNEHNHDNYDFLLKPWTIHMLWLLYNNPYISELTLRKFMTYLWNREEGIYYLYNYPVAKCVNVEDRHFLKWIYALEHVSGVRIFADLASKEVQEHLIKQALKIIHKEAEVPKSGPVLGHYHESWRKDDLCCCDMVLRIARIISKY